MWCLDLPFEKICLCRNISQLVHSAAFCSVVDRKMVFKDVYILIPATCDYVILHGQRDFEDVMRVCDERENYPGLSRWVQSNHLSPSKWRTFLDWVKEMRWKKGKEWFKAWQTWLAIVDLKTEEGGCESIQQHLEIGKHAQFTVSKEMVTLVLQPQRTEFCQQCEWGKKKCLS